MTEDEFKITIRAFFPTLGFTQYDCDGEAPIVVSDYLHHDLLGTYQFRYERGKLFIGHLDFRMLHIEQYPNAFIETVKHMKQNDWYPVVP